MVAQRFGYTTAALNSAVRDFRGGAQEFFLTVTPGPKSAPGKDAARSRIIELRADGHSIDEIAVALSAEGLGLNRTAPRHPGHPRDRPACADDAHLRPVGPVVHRKGRPVPGFLVLRDGSLAIPSLALVSYNTGYNTAGWRSSSAGSNMASDQGKPWCAA